MHTLPAERDAAGLWRSPRRLLTVITAALVLVPAVVLTPPVSRAGAAQTGPDGASPATAAASCWEIKQNRPDASDGVYWLNTPALGAPDQFYCDQTTAGGGWVLIGRGREGWTMSNEGQGTRASVASTVTGQAAFAARQLSTTTVDALLDGGRVGDLEDGVRLRRALNVTGTSFQDAEFRFASPRDDWSWAFQSDQRIGSWSIGDRRGNGGTTAWFGTGSLTAVRWTPSREETWATGFGYGGRIGGSTAADSFLLQGANGYTRPFTQVMLRPKLTAATIFERIDDAGTPEQSARRTVSSFAEPTVWGVSGLGAAGSGIQNTEISAFAESNGVVFAGGNFRDVRRNSSGAGRVEQSYLAAFDVLTGELITSFRPTFDNQVKAIAALPDGRIAVGGSFSTVNGRPANGLVVLEADGSTSTRYTGALVNRLSSSQGRAIVRTLDVQDGWLYAGGSFTHAIGGSARGEVYSRSAVRLSVTDGTPDASWRMELNGTVISLDASSRGDRVFLAGYFAANRGDPALRAAAVTTGDATTIPWEVAFSAGAERDGYQQAVREIGDRVWLGGAEHMLYSYDRDSMEELSTNVTNWGGDFQAIGSDGDDVIAGCHCSMVNYSGARTWPNVGTEWTSADRIDQTGIWSASTGAYQPRFSPVFSLREGAGTWAVLTDSTGVTWMGGDFTGARRTSTTSQWAGGFVRFSRVDSVAPSTPSNPAVVREPAGDTLRWGASDDDRGVVSYQILAEDRVVATTSAHTVTLPSAPDGTRYFVRAADAAGNLSASTAAAVAAVVPPTGPDPADDAQLVASGSVWEYRTATSAPAADWTTTPGGDGWSSGGAPLGRGHADITTVLDPPAPRPLTAYFRKSVEIADPLALAALTLTTRADDGVVVYVNGREVGRSNMPAGRVGHETYALSAVNAATAVANPVQFTVHANALREGVNVIAAEVHSNFRNTPSASFELTATSIPASPGGEPQDPVPLAPGTVVVADGSTWSYRHATEGPSADWRDATADISGWPAGTAPIGWGDASIVTTLTAPSAGRPLATYYRTTFAVPPGAIPVDGLTLTTRADDGIAVWVNGVEIGRTNLPSATLTHTTTWATSAVSTRAALASPVTYEVPATVLRDGDNIVSVQVQSNYRSTPNSSFDLEAVVR